VTDIWSSLVESAHRNNRHGENNSFLKMISVMVKVSHPCYVPYIKRMRWSNRVTNPLTESKLLPACRVVSKRITSLESHEQVEYFRDSNPYLLVAFSDDDLVIASSCAIRF